MQEDVIALSAWGLISLGNVCGFEIPEDLYYDAKNHVWVKIVNGGALVGPDNVG